MQLLFHPMLFISNMLHTPTCLISNSSSIIIVDRLHIPLHYLSPIVTVSIHTCTLFVPCITCTTRNKQSAYVHVSTHYMGFLEYILHMCMYMYMYPCTHVGAYNIPITRKLNNINEDKMQIKARRMKSVVW